MQYQEILELVKAVSEAGLSNFEYKEGNISISMSCPEVKTNAVVPIVQVQEGTETYEISQQPQVQAGQPQQPAAQPSMSGYPQPIPGAAAQYPTPDFSGVPDSYAWGPGGTPIDKPPF